MNFRSSLIAIKRTVQLTFAIAMAALATSASAQSGNSYNIPQLRGNVDNATVVQTRPVTVESQGWQERSVGTAVGGALGAVIANSVAGRNRNSASRILVAGLGAAAGGYAGNRVAEHLSKREAQEVIIQAPNGRMYAVVQPMPAQHLNPGESVRVLQQGGQTRIIRSADMQQESISYQPMHFEQGYRQPMAVQYQNPYGTQTSHEHKLSGDN